MATESESATTAKPTSADDLRRSMAKIRQRLHQDMQGVVAGAEAASDWHHYVRLYPFAFLGAAFAAGYFVVPRKRRSVSATAEEAADAAVAKVAGTVKKAADKAAEAAPEPRKKKEGKGLIGMGLALLGPFLLRAGQSYAMNYVETWIAQQQPQQPPEAPPSGRPPGQAQRPGY